ncbi:hypothetical protein PTKIN_Ptkin19aG0050100 [Pterospermum kingtungense]
MTNQYTDWSSGYVVSPAPSSVSFAATLLQENLADITVIFLAFAYLIVRGRYHRRRKLLENKLVFEGREFRIEFSFLRKVVGVPIKFKHKELEDAIDGSQALLGQGPRFLVYRFIPNGSLDYWIFPRRETRNHLGGCLSWDLRYRVTIDVAQALSYLHHDCRSRILHLDVKPENILLDENYRSIVADFGLSKLMGKDESKVITTVRGTRDEEDSDCHNRLKITAMGSYVDYCNIPCSSSTSFAVSVLSGR